MNPDELDKRLSALVVYLKRQGGQAWVTTGKSWQHYKIVDLVEAVEAARKRIKKVDAISTERHGNRCETEQSGAVVQFPLHKKVTP